MVEPVPKRLTSDGDSQFVGDRNRRGKGQRPRNPAQTRQRRDIGGIAGQTVQGLA